VSGVGPVSASLVAIGLALLGLALLLGTSGHPLTRAGGGSLALGCCSRWGRRPASGALALIAGVRCRGLDGPATIGVGFTAGGALLAVAALVVGALTGGPGFVWTRLRWAGVRADALGRPAVYLGWVPTRWPTGCSSSCCAASRPVRRRSSAVLETGHRDGARGARARPAAGRRGMVGAGLLCAAAVVVAGWAARNVAAGDRSLFREVVRAGELVPPVHRRATATNWKGLSKRPGSGRPGAAACRNSATAR